MTGTVAKKIDTLTVLNDDWKLDAGCRGKDVNLFYGPENEHSTATVKREREIIEFCYNSCKVRARCLLWALFIPETYGVWGGMNADSRKILRAQPETQTFMKQFKIDNGL